MNLQEQKELTLANLKKVYKELPELAKKNPLIAKDFNMSLLGVFEARSMSSIKRNECSTCGCLLGNMARVFVVKLEYFNLGRNGLWNFNYKLFGRAEFPCLYDKGLAIDKPNHLWLFLFSERWIYHQPSFDQAIKRLKFIIDCNLDIPTWEFQEEEFIFTEK